MTSSAHSMQHYQSTRRDLLRLLRMLVGFLLGFALAAWVCFANAAMTGYQFGFRCFPNTSELLIAFQDEFVRANLGTSYLLCDGTKAPSVIQLAASPGYPFYIGYYKSNVVQALNQPVSCPADMYRQVLGIASCDPDVQSLAFTGTNALFLVLGFFYAAMLGFKTGYRA